MIDQLPHLDGLSEPEKDALIQVLWAEIQALKARIAELEAKLQEPKPVLSQAEGQKRNPRHQPTTAGNTRPISSGTKKTARSGTAIRHLTGNGVGKSNQAG